MDSIKAILIFCFIVFIVVTVIFLNYWIRREVNYNLMYKKMVKQTITEMVKPEALR